jgi:hypothetical protein
MPPKPFIEKARWLQWFLPILLLSGISSFAISSLSSPVIFSDDWCYIISTYVFGSLNLVDWASRRPFTLTLYNAVLSIAGLRLQYLYILNFIIITASGVLLYVLIRRSFPKFTWMALPATLVYLVYPVDYTRTWMVTVYIHLVQLITYGILFLLVDFALQGRAWKVILACIGFILTLGAYEGQFGLVTGAAALLVLSPRSISKKSRIALSSIFLAGVLFIVWRMLIQPQWLNIHDNYFQEIQFSPVVLIYRFYLAVSVFTVGWAAPLAAYLGLSQTLLILLVYGLGLAAALAVYLLPVGAHLGVRPGQTHRSAPTIGILQHLGMRPGQAHTPSGVPKRFRSAPTTEIPSEPETFTWVKKESLLKGLLATALLGAFFWAAGYVPGLAIFNPTWSGVASRGNSFPIAGASLLLVSLAAYAVMLVARSLAQARAMTLAAVVPFILMGALAQVWMHTENAAAWNDQKQLWNGMFNILPGLKDGTIVMVVIPGYDHLRPLQRLPLTAQWEASCGTAILYHNPTVSARFYYPDVPLSQPVLLSSGVKDWDNDAIIPYVNTVFVSFDPVARSVKVIERIEDVIPLPFNVIGYAPQDRIIPQPPGVTVYRWLVK